MVRETKSSANIFAGYLYQNLVGLELLCDWMNDPTVFKRVSFSRQIIQNFVEVRAIRTRDVVLCGNSDTG